MAEQNIEVQGGEPQADPASRGTSSTNANGAGEDQQHDDGDALEALKAERDALKKAHGDLLNEKKRWRKADEARAAITERLKKWLPLDEEGADPDALREHMKAREEAELGDAKAKGDVEKLIANRDQHWGKVIAKKDEETKKLVDSLSKRDQTIQEITVDRELKDELAKIVEPVYINAVFALLRPKARGLEDPEAPYGVRSVMMVGDNEMSIRDFITQWAEADPDSQAFLIGNKSTGGGAPAGGRAGGLPHMRRSQMTAKQISDFLGKYGADRFQQLPR